MSRKSKRLSKMQSPSLEKDQPSTSATDMDIDAVEAAVAIAVEATTTTCHDSPATPPEESSELPVKDVDTAPTAEPETTHEESAPGPAVKQPKPRKKRIRAPLLKRPECPFDGCSMTFSTSGHLARHYKIHSGVRTHRCPIEGCDKSFARKDNMTHHFNTHKRKIEAKERAAAQKALIPAAVTTAKDNASPTVTLCSEAENLSAEEKDSASTTSNSGRTVASVSPTSSFTVSATEAAAGTSSTSETSSKINSVFEGNILHERRPRSAPLCNINTSSTFLNNYHSGPLSSGAGFVNPSMLSATGAHSFDLSQTFFDSPAFPFTSAPLSAPLVNNTPPYTVQPRHQSSLQSAHPLYFENFETKSWSPKSAALQFDEHFSNYYSTGPGGRKRSISHQTLDHLHERRASNSWSSFSLDFLST